MEATLTQPRRVQEDAPTGCKLLFCEKKALLWAGCDGIAGISTG